MDKTNSYVRVLGRQVDTDRRAGRQIGYRRNRRDHHRLVINHRHHRHRLTLAEAFAAVISKSNPASASSVYPPILSILSTPAPLLPPSVGSALAANPTTAAMVTRLLADFMVVS